MFSTTSFSQRDLLEDDISTAIEESLGSLADFKGVVVECERVIASIIGNKDWKEASPVLVPSISEGDIGKRALSTLPIEIHHGFDLIKNPTESNPPLELYQLLDDRDLGLNVGGWFRFEKETAWAYRSNLFTGYDDYKEIAQEHHARLTNFLKKLDRDNKLWTIVEQIVGLWKIGRDDTSNDSRLTVPLLARWEESCGPSEDFWVITPNFLGDKDPNFHHAMLSNLQKNVSYTYFLRSFADLQRLRQLTELLAMELAEDVSSRINPILLWQSTRIGSQIEKGLSEDIFIAGPENEKERQGYKLHRDSKDRVKSATQLDEAHLESIVNLLLPLTKRGAQGILLQRLDTSGSSVAVAYTDLESSFDTMQRVGPQLWEDILASYDKIVASEVSKIGGEVVKALGDGYLLIFRDAGAAFRCARRLQRRIEERNNTIEDPKRHIPRQRIGMDYGHVTWVERSHGYDVGGHILSRCARVADFAQGGHILITKTFYDLAVFSFPREEFSKVVVPLGNVSGDFENVELFEILWRNHQGIQIQPMELPSVTA